MKQLIVLVGAILISTYSLVAFESASAHPKSLEQSLSTVWQSQTNNHLQQDKNDILVGYGGADIISERSNVIPTIIAV